MAIRNVPFTPLGSPINPDTGARERTIDRHTIIYDVEAGEGIGPCAGDVNVLTISGPCHRREGTLH